MTALTGVSEDRLERLSGGDLSELVRFPRSDGRWSVAKGGPAVATEAEMLRALAAAGIPTPGIESEHGHVLIMSHVEHDGVMSPAAWSAIGATLGRLHRHRGQSYGWPVDYRLGTVELDNRQQGDWPDFWGTQRLMATAAILDRPWRQRVERLARRLPDLLPAAPPPALLHGDCWSGNILVRGGAVAALIDPACYHGDPEVDLAMLALFDSPPADFLESYGPPEPGWRERRPVYQLFPALVHLRLFGASYAPMVERLLAPFD